MERTDIVTKMFMKSQTMTDLTEFGSQWATWITVLTVGKSTRRECNSSAPHDSDAVFVVSYNGEDEGQRKEVEKVSVG